MRRILIGVWSAVLCFGSVLIGSHALAAGEGVDAPKTEEGCFPACREGYTCHESQCVSLCNPPCGNDEKCQGEGQCVKVSTTTEAATPPAKSEAPKAPVKSESSEASDTVGVIGEDPSSSSATDEGTSSSSYGPKEMRSVGMVVVGATGMIIGGSLLLVGLPLLALGDMRSCETDETGLRSCSGINFTRSGTALTLSGLGLAAIGIPVLVIGATRVPKDQTSAQATVVMGPGSLQLVGKF